MLAFSPAFPTDIVSQVLHAMHRATLFAAPLSPDYRPIDPDSHFGWRRMPVSVCPQHSRTNQIHLNFLFHLSLYAS